MNSKKYFLRVLANHSLLAVAFLAFYSEGASLGPTDQPVVGIASAVSRAKEFLDKNKKNNYVLTWAYLENSFTSPSRKWITVWHQDGKLGSAHGTPLAIEVASEQGDDNLTKYIEKTMISSLEELSVPCKFEEALDAAQVLFDGSEYKENYYVFRCGLGHFDKEDKIYWIICLWPTRLAKDIDARPVAAVDSRKKAEFRNDKVTWLAYKPLTIAPRDKVPPPQR